MKLTVTMPVAWMLEGFGLALVRLRAATADRYICGESSRQFKIAVAAVRWLARLRCLLGSHVPTFLLQSSNPEVESYICTCQRCGRVYEARVGRP